MPRQETVSAIYKFTDAEAMQNAKDLAEKLNEATRIENQFASIKAEFKAKTERVKAEIGVLTNKVGSGEEVREYRCTVELDIPNKQRKYIDLNTGEIIKTEPFHVEDYQTQLPFEDENGGDDFGDGDFEDTNLTDFRDAEETISDDAPE